MADGRSNIEEAVAVEHIGLNIRTILNLAARTYEQLSQEVLIPIQTLKGYADGEGRIGDDRVQKIADALAVPTEVLQHQFTDASRAEQLRNAINGQAVELLVDAPLQAHVAGELVTPDSDYPEWWNKGGSGRVPLWALAPDPNQPRQHMDEDELAALAESIRQRGIRQTLTITPLWAAPWANHDAEAYPNAHFLIVSGHRRTEAGLMAEVADAPAEVKLYESQTDHWLDGSLLNGLRADLSPIEQGYELARLRSSVTLEQLAQIMGRSVTWVLERLALTRLDPWIQRYRLHPKYVDQGTPKLSLKVAAKLGSISDPGLNLVRIISARLNQPLDMGWEGDEDERRYKVQRVILQVIETEDMGALKASDFVDRVIENRAIRSGTNGPKTIRRAKEPRKMRERIDNTLRGMSEAAIFSWDDRDFGHAFDGVSNEQLTRYLEEAELTRAQLDELIERFQQKLGVKPDAQ